MSEDTNTLIEKAEATFKIMRDEQKAHNEEVEKKGAETTGRMEAVEASAKQLAIDLELVAKAQARKTETSQFNADDEKALEELNRNIRGADKSGKRKALTMQEAKDTEAVLKKLVQNRGGQGSLDMAEQKLINGVIDPAGGYFMMTQIDPALTKKAFDARGFINSASNLTTGRRSWEKFSDLGSYEDSRYKSELDLNADPTNDDRFKKVSIEAGIQYYPELFTREFLEDDELNIQNDILNGMQEGMLRKDAQGAIDGTGTNNNPLKGILSYEEGVEFGKIERILSTGTGAIDLDDILNLLPSGLKEAYHGGASFTMARKMYNNILTLKDTAGSYRFDRHWNLFEGAQMTFFSYPVIWDAGLSSSVATDAQPILFGDNAEAYQVIKRLGFSMHKDDSKADRLTLTGRTRVGGGVKNFEAIKVLKIK
jgi:HK97 family phage major capsid protein